MEECYSRACYEGTNSQTTFKLRVGNKFDIHATGVFFYEEHFVGSYEQLGDALVLNYEGAMPGTVGRKLYMDREKELLTTIGSDSDSSRYLIFYFGYCKGLN